MYQTNTDLEKIYCPWCGKRYSEVDHSIGCPEPDPTYNPERQKELTEFCEFIYSGGVSKYIKEQKE